MIFALSKPKVPVEAGRTTPFFTGGSKSKERTCLELACILLSKELKDKKTRKKGKSE
jgi:hypothetical protein